MNSGHRGTSRPWLVLSCCASSRWSGEPLGFDDAVGRQSGRLDRGRHRPGVRRLEHGQAGVLGGDDDRADVPRVIGHPVGRCVAATTDLTSASGRYRSTRKYRRLPAVTVRKLASRRPVGHP